MIDSFDNMAVLKLSQIDDVVTTGCERRPRASRRRPGRPPRRSGRSSRAARRRWRRGTTRCRRREARVALRCADAEPLYGLVQGQE